MPTSRGRHDDVITHNSAHGAHPSPRADLPSVFLGGQIAVVIVDRREGTGPPMAKVTRTLTELTDDIDGGDASETIPFAVDGVGYEIDLNDENAAALRELFASYVGHARKASRGGSSRKASPAPAKARAAAAPAGRTADIRAWAREQGLPVNERGRIAADIVDKYEAAH